MKKKLSKLKILFRFKSLSFYLSKLSWGKLSKKTEFYISIFCCKPLQILAA